MLPLDPSRTEEAYSADAVALGPPGWLLALERAQIALHRAARALENAPATPHDLAAAARSLEAAIASAFAAIDLREDRVTAIRAASASADRALDTLGPIDGDPGLEEAASALREARTALKAADERLTRIPPDIPPEPPALRVSLEVPGLHSLRRASLAPSLQIATPVQPPPPRPAPPPKPRDLKELEAAMTELARRSDERKKERDSREAALARAVAPASEGLAGRPGFVRAVDPAISERAFVHARARECFEEVAMIGAQRAPLLGDPWRTSAVLERRMLAAIDALAALGHQAIAALEPLVMDSPAKDPSRAFAATMILGCVAGRDSLAAAERVARHLGLGDPEVPRELGAALKLVPHPDLALMLRSLLADPDPALCAVGIDVLGYRGLATDAELASAALDASPAVVVAALPWLALARPMDVGAVAEPLLGHADLALREAAWSAMGLAGHARCAEVLVRELSGPNADRAAPYLAIVCDDKDAERLLERAHERPTRQLVTALGWAGAASAVPALISLLRHDDEPVRLAAAYALDRITGARLYEDVEVPPEDVMVPDVDEPKVSEAASAPLARAVSDPRDEPSPGADDTITRPTTRIDRWSAYWRERGSDYRPSARYRRGHPYTPLVSLWELDAWPVTPPERRLLQRELVVRTGQFVRFDPHDFVSVQEEALRQWEPVARRASSAPGSFGRPTRR